jgi:hypothetical protein
MAVRTPTPTGSPGRDCETPDAAIASPEPAFELIDFDRYVVLHDEPVGYVEVVSPVFVCYLGHPYARAEEIAQVVHDFDRAVQIVSERAVSAQRHKLTT